ncbi:MAG: polyprenyl synthetase family protein [Prevotella sp.]|nr:polyprenyl synthetase family protein [Prevotella sp.]
MIQTPAQLALAVNAFLENVPRGRQPETLYEPIAYTLSGGGKRLRPVLLLMAYGLFRDDFEKVLPVAAGLETYHNYTLLHDDLMDKSDLRRGRPTVHKKWDENTAILSGDAMLVLAYRLVSQCDSSKLPAVLACFSETALEIGEGQQFDMDFETRDDVSEGEYVEMIRLKTGVLLACAMKIGGILAGAAEGDCALLYKAGEAAGLAFQLQDDWLDVYGDEAVFGKPIGGDICNNKKTFLLIKALETARGGDRCELLRQLAATTFEPKAKIAAVTAVYDRLGVGAMARKEIEKFFAESISLIKKINAADERKAALVDYVNSLKDRQL